jgi:hypothetical protein
MLFSPLVDQPTLVDSFSRLNPEATFPNSWKRTHGIKVEKDTWYKDSRHLVERILFQEGVFPISRA